MKITLEMNKEKYVVETSFDDYNAGEMKEYFSRLLVMATYHPDVIELSDDYGQYKYVGEDETVVKIDYLNQLERKKEGERKNES